MTGSSSADGTQDALPRIQYGDRSVHLAFQQQLAATGPRCGGGLSVSLKLKTDGPPQEDGRDED